MTPNAEKQFAMQIMLVEIYLLANDLLAPNLVPRASRELMSINSRLALGTSWLVPWDIA